MPSFRLKARTATNVACGSVMPLLGATLGRPAELIPIETDPFGQNHIDIRSEGYATTADAIESSSHLSDLLLVLGATTGYGIDLTKGTQDFSDDLKENAFSETGHHLEPDNRGVTIYEPPTQFFRFGAQLSVTEDAATFLHHLNEVSALRLPLTDRQRLAAELLNDTYFEPSPNSVFILSVSAVEALCPATPPSKFFQATIANLIDQVEKMQTAQNSFSDEENLDLEDVLRKLNDNKKRNSVRSGYLTKIRALLNHDVAKEFDKLYMRRSKFVHDGLGRNSFTEDAPRARAIATDLLLADIATNASSSGHS